MTEVQRKAQEAFTMRQGGATYESIGDALQCSRQHARRLCERGATAAGLDVPTIHRPADPVQVRLMLARAVKMEALARIAQRRADDLAATLIPRTLCMDVVRAFAACAKSIHADIARQSGAAAQIFEEGLSGFDRFAEKRLGASTE